MASITIRKLDDALKAKLRLHAARHGRSMEDEARHILRTALAGEDARDGASLLKAIRQRFARLGGIELDIPPRTKQRREPPSFAR
jgi:plasmid stability protein